MSRVVIVQPYIPQYRKPFFEKLTVSLGEQGIDLQIAAPPVRGAQSMRGDAIRPQWIIEITRRELPVGSRRLVLGGARPAWGRSDAVILGNRGTSLDNYLALLDQRVRGLRVGLWGHIKDYVNPPSRLDAALEKIQLRAADHVFAYVPSGAAYAESLGIQSTRVTTVMNTIDDTELHQSMQRVRANDTAAFRAEHGIGDRRAFAYIGGLDSSKRIHFLVEAVDRALTLRDDFVLLVGGLGGEKYRFDELVRRGRAIMLGYADTATKAKILTLSDAILMPGRIGLVAVEALISGRPVITTRWPYHAPEYEYLEEGKSVFAAENNVEMYARAIATFPEPNGAPQSWAYPTMNDMVSNFTTGVMRMLADF